MRRPRFLRFGLLATFAAMLNVISVAGWLRSELDLYREEQAILADLSQAGCTAAVYRGTLNAKELYRRNKYGFAWYEPEWLTRMTSLYISGDPPQSLVRRAAALPTLQSLKAVPKDRAKTLPFPKAPLPPPEFPLTSELLERTLPEFREAEIQDSAVNSPLPEGRTIEGTERDAMVNRIRNAWKSDLSQMPARFVKRIETVDPIFPPAGMKVDLVRDGDAYWSVQRGGVGFADESRLLTLRNEEGQYGLAFEDSHWILARQADADVDPLWGQQIALRHSKSDLPRPYYLDYRFPTLAILDHVARLARVDGHSVRVDVEPFEVDITVDPASPAAYDVDEMTLILRKDMGWAVGSERSTITFMAAKTRGTSTTHVLERTYERRDGYVLPVEEVRGFPGPPRRRFVVPATVAIEEPVTYVPFRTRYAWELNPDLVPAIFDPNRYLAESLPPRTRAFPWWYVTLAVGGALGCYLILRKIVFAFGRRQRPAVAVEPAAAG